MSESKRSLMPGVLLIGFGLWLIADRLNFGAEIEIILPVLGVVFSGFLLYEAMRMKRTSPLFWGTSILIVSIFFLLRNTELVMYLYPDEYWPLFPLAIALGFIAQFLMQPKEWGVLIPAAILGAVGVTGALDIAGIWLDGWDSIGSYFWPVLIILIGAGILIKSFKKSNDQDQISE